MAKQKQSSNSAAQRREQTRQQRQQRQNTSSRSPKSRYQRGQVMNSPWFFIGGILVMVAVVIGIFVFLSYLQNASAGTKTATPTVFHDITNVSPTLLSTVGAGSVNDSAKHLLFLTKGAPIQAGPGGKPQVFYMGAEYCPYCAAQRWSMIIALSRFGKFGKPLTAMIASEGNVPTYTFHKNNTYRSDYIDFVPVEVQDLQGNPLESLSTDQQQIVKKYDAVPYSTNDGGLPFISIGNQYVESGAFYAHDLLAGKTYPQIVDEMRDTNSDLSKGMLGSANYLTAAICKMTNNQPATVCTTNPVKQIQQKLPTNPLSLVSLPLTAFDSPVALITRRED